MSFPNIWTLPPFRRIYHQYSHCDFVLHSDLETCPCTLCYQHLLFIPSPLLTTTKISVFFFIVCTLLPSILTSSAWSSIVLTQKLTYLFLISVQLEAHSSSWRLTRKLRTKISSSDFNHCIHSTFFLYKSGLLSTSHVNLSTSSTIGIAVWRKTQGLCTLLQLGSNCFDASAGRQAQIRASYRYQQQFRCLENGSGCNF